MHQKTDMKLKNLSQGEVIFPDAISRIRTIGGDGNHWNLNLIVSARVNHEMQAKFALAAS